MDIIRALLFCLLKIIASKELGRILDISQDGSSNTTYGRRCIYMEVTQGPEYGNHKRPFILPAENHYADKELDRSLLFP
jgi:hypothetical protein